MKKKDFANLRSKTVSELAKEANQKRLDVVKVKADMYATKEKNLKRVKNLRRDLSQTLTLMREKQIIEKVKEEK